MGRSDDLVEREGRLVSAAAHDGVYGMIRAWNVAGSFAVEIAFDGMVLLVPLRLVFGESLGERQVALADVVSARVGLVGALDVLASIGVGDQVEPVADVFACAAALAVVLLLEAVVTLLEVLASSVDVVSRLSVSAARDVVRSFGQAVAAVVAVATELLLLLQPEDHDLQLAEFASLDFGDDTRTFAAAKVEDQLVDFVRSSV